MTTPYPKLRSFQQCPTGQALVSLHAGPWLKRCPAQNAAYPHAETQARGRAPRWPFQPLLRSRPTMALSTAAQKPPRDGPFNRCSEAARPVLDSCDRCDRWPQTQRLETTHTNEPGRGRKSQGQGVGRAALLLQLQGDSGSVPVSASRATCAPWLRAPSWRYPDLSFPSPHLVFLSLPPPSDKGPAGQPRVTPISGSLTNHMGQAPCCVRPHIAGPGG